MTDLDRRPDEQPDSPEGHGDDANRRDLLRKLALGGGAAAVGAMAFGRTASAGDQGGGATGGNAVELGLTNTATDPTIIDLTPGTPPLEQGPSAFSAGGYVPAADAPFPAGVGGYGDPTVPNGVHGSTIDAAGFGVVAANLTPDAPADTEPPPVGLAVASVNGPQVKFVTLDGAVVGPTPGLHEPGELYVDADGTLWFTVPIPATEGGARFVKLAGTPTSGALHLLQIPVRVADTRESVPGPKPPSKGSIEVDLTTDITGEDSGFPAGATGALLTVTVTNTEIRGFFRAFAKGETIPEDVPFSSGNWVGDDTTVAASVTTRADSDGLIVVELGGFGTADVVVDVVGYYL